MLNIEGLIPVAYVSNIGFIYLVPETEVLRIGII